jgi:RNA polymerase sigma-70 factor (ECF subfamily)
MAAIIAMRAAAYRRIAQGTGAAERTQVGVTRGASVAGDESAPDRPVVIAWRASTRGTRPLRRDELADVELWDLAVDGDHEAFGALFERHARSVYNHCFRRTASWADAEDLTSAVFVEAWRRRRDVDLIDESARPWLLGVANNVLRNHRRSLRRYRAAVERLPSPGPQADPADDVAGRLADERQMNRVLGLVERLPRRDQEVLTLCAWSELTYQEAATVLDVPVGTVRSRLARARARLAELVGNPPSRTDTDGMKLNRASRKVEEEQ